MPPTTTLFRIRFINEEGLVLHTVATVAMNENQAAQFARDYAKARGRPEKWFELVQLMAVYEV